jgi:hypothetical protein
MLQDGVQANESLASEKEVWDEWENRLVTWSLTAAIVALVIASLLINFFLV